MRRLAPLLLLCVLAALLAAPALAQEEPEPPPAPTEPPPPPEPPPPAPQPPPPPPEPTIAEGVTIAGVGVGEMTFEEARTALKRKFDRPLTFAFKRKRWRVAPARLGARAAFGRAVRKALAAPPGAQLRLPVRVNRWRIRRYVDRLDRRFSREPTNSVLTFRRARPYITKARSGRDVKNLVMRRAIRRALVKHERRALRLRVKLLRPAVTRRSFGAIVVIHRGSKRLVLYRGMRFVRRFRVATGLPQYPTPLGLFSIVTKQRHPWWYPPASEWAAGMKPIPPGPGNPLGTRWMGLSSPGVGIHGTPDAASIGYSASHGCIRMRIRQAEWLFERVSVGTPVLIVRR